MGGVDNICSDKTGTLTENKMSVRKIFAMEQVYTEFKNNTFNEDFNWKLCKSICQNSNANPKISVKENGSLENIQIGNKTECALLEMAFKLGFNYKEHRVEDNIKQVYCFSSKTKSMTTVSEENKKDKQLFIWTKGAPDFLLSQCNAFVNKEGKV